MAPMRDAAIAVTVDNEVGSPRDFCHYLIVAWTLSRLYAIKRKFRGNYGHTRTGFRR